MGICTSDNFQNVPVGHVLPSSWRTLSVLQQLNLATFQAAVAAGKIHPEMTRADAEALLPKRTLAPVVSLSDVVL